MADHRPCSSYESNNTPWSEAVARRATRTGQELKAFYHVPQDLPREMHQLLMQLNARYQKE
jgi:hypothetical protein